MRCLAQGLVRPARDGNKGYRLLRGNLDLRGYMGDRIGTNGAGNGVVSRMTRGAPRIVGNGRAVVPITSAVADSGSRVCNGQNVIDIGDNHDHNHVEEVIHSNNDHHKFPVIAGRLEQAVNRQ